MDQHPDDIELAMAVRQDNSYKSYLEPGNHTTLPFLAAENPWCMIQKKRNGLLIYLNDLPIKSRPKQYGKMMTKPFGVPVTLA